MAAAYRTSQAGGGTTGTTDRTLLYTTNAGDFVLVFYSVSGASSCVCSDNLSGGTYTLVDSVLGTDPDLYVFVRDNLVATGTNMTVTLDTDTNTSGEIVIVAFSGMAAGGIGKIRTHVKNNGTSSTTPNVVLSQAALTTNPTVVAMAGLDTTQTPPTNWTERQDVSQSSPVSALEVATRDSGFTGTTITWGAASSNNWFAVGIELDGDNNGTLANTQADNTCSSNASLAPTFVAVGSGSAGTTSVAPAVPSGSNGDLLLLFVASKYAYPTTPSGWIDTVDKSRSSAGHGSPGAGSGTAYGAVFFREADGTEGSTQSVTIPSGNSARANILRFQKGTGAYWGINCAIGSDTTTGTAWSATGDIDPGIQGGDLLVVCTAANGFQSTTWSSEAVSATGVTFGTMTEDVDNGTSNGDTVAELVTHHLVSSGTSSAAPVYTATASTSGADSECGPTIFVRLRQVTSDTATFTVTQDGNTLSSNGLLEKLATLAATQADNTLSSAGALLIQGSLSQTQTDNSLSAAGQLLIQGSLSQAQADNTLSATGELSTNEITATLGVTQDDNTVDAQTQFERLGSVAVTQADQTSSAAGQLLIQGTLAVTQDAQTASDAAQLLIQGTLARAQAGDSLAATGQLERIASLAQTQASDTLSAAAKLDITGSLDGAQAGDTLDAVAGQIRVGDLDVTQADNSLSAAGAVRIAGLASLSEDSNALSATGDLFLQGSLSHAQGADSLSSAAQLEIHATLAKTQAAGSLAASGALLIQGSLSAAQNDQVAAAEAGHFLEIKLFATQADNTLVATILREYVGSRIIVPARPGPLVVGAAPGAVVVIDTDPQLTAGSSDGVIVINDGVQLLNIGANQ